MRTGHTKTITMLITGAVFTAGLIMGFGGYVFAGGPVPGLDITIESNPGGRVSDTIYDSSFSKTKSIGQVRKEVGDVLLRYGFGGEYINQVTEALEGGGVYEAELKSFLLAIGMNEKDTQDILLEFDKVGISKKDSAQGLDAPTLEFTEGAAPSAVDSSGKSVTSGELRTPATTLPQQPSAGTGEQRFKDIQGLDSETRSGGFIKLGDLPGQEAAFRDSAMKSIQDLKAAESEEEAKKIRQELEDNRRTLLLPAIQRVRESLSANAKDIRDNFRENVKTTIGHVDHGKTGRIALAHGKGLRMINRYRSAIARFDHILGRLESRVEKIGIEAQARATEKGKIKDYFPAAIPLIEEAKNTQDLNKAKLVELQAKYESLLLGENAGGIADEARAIAKELKSEIEKLHGLLDDIRQSTGTINTTKSNTF